jgi:Uma2 family endonuclease
MSLLSDTPADRRRPIRFTPTDYYALSDMGLLRTPTELVDGEIIEMPSQYHAVVAAIGRITDALRDAWFDRDRVVSDMTVAFPSGWLPRPDVAVFDEVPPRHPKRVTRFPMPRLVVEVSASTLDYDLGEKARRYAAEAVPDYWVAEVEDETDPEAQPRRLHVLRDPDPDGYAIRTTLGVGEAVSPLCLPEVRFAVADLLPAYPPENDA